MNRDWPGASHWLMSIRDGLTDMLLAELSQHLDMLQLQPLSPGLKSALRQTLRKIKASASM